MQPQGPVTYGCIGDTEINRSSLPKQAPLKKENNPSQGRLLARLLSLNYPMQPE